MQRLRAVVKTFKADSVCQALLAAGVDEVYVEEVQGYGRQKGHLGLYRQPAYGISFLPKIAITAYVSDALVEAACAAIESAAATGTIGDGKIFLAPVEYAIPQSLEKARMAGATAAASDTTASAAPAGAGPRGRGRAPAQSTKLGKPGKGQGRTAKEAGPKPSRAKPAARKRKPR